MLGGVKLLEVNSFMNSDDKDFNEIGLFLYRRNNGERGLSKNETEVLIKMIYNIQDRAENEIAEELEKAFEKGYSEGFSEGQWNCHCE
jgi:flagellar biosynthesis/type III secretory pathway protein FliH